MAGRNTGTSRSKVVDMAEANLSGNGLYKNKKGVSSEHNHAFPGDIATWQR
jgi:hypothetical protein